MKRFFYVRHTQSHIFFDQIYISESGATRLYIACSRDSVGNLKVAGGKGSLSGVDAFREMMVEHEVPEEQYFEALNAVTAWNFD
jgi:hypothetical protein